MKKRKVGEVNIDTNTKAEFYLTDVTLCYPNKEPRPISYNDIRFVQEMLFEDKEKYIIGLYIRDPNSAKDPTLTFGDFSEAKDFLEAFYSLKNAIPTFENELIGFFGNVLLPKQKPKKCELGLDQKHIMIRAVDDDSSHFFRIEVNNCKIEDLSSKNMIRISLMQSQLEVINLSRKDDVFLFKKLMYKAIDESTKEHAVIYDDIEDVDKFKIYLLETSPYLKNLHEKLVISGAMNEQEFWESRAEFQEYKKYSIENKQKLSKNTGLFIKDKITSELEKQRILTQYPEVKGSYLLEVMDGDNFNFESDKKFWEEFMKLQKKKDTEIVGGKNPVAVPSTQNIYQFGDVHRKVDLSEIPLGDVDLCRNLDIKTNVAEKLMHETLKEHYGDYEPGKNDVESTIKRFQIHGLNVLGGIKPVPNIQATSIQEIIDEFKDLVPEHLEIPEDMLVKKVKVNKDSNSPLKGKNDDKMIIENISLVKSSSQGLDGRNAKVHAEATASKLQKLLENKAEAKERRKNIFNKNDMQNVFKELVQASIQKEETLEFNQYREAYENFHEQAQDLLRLYYSAGHAGHTGHNCTEESCTENKRRTMKNLINELIGKINLYLGDLDKEIKRQMVQPTPDKTKEHTKLTKVMETVLEQLKFAVNVKE